eukprot:TRINITY_DN31161_c0_g1_i1.p1 TRINITY_DN31161_c0_g1~~TRINITY_DN31161_c0_g1_i1.p1  ORF type:complete len:396 (-),score=99.16 TRINITY_DN31161_c0_g1_i1:163-1350(-)
MALKDLSNFQKLTAFISVILVLNVFYFWYSGSISSFSGAESSTVATNGLTVNELHDLIKELQQQNEDLGNQVKTLVVKLEEHEKQSGSPSPPAPTEPTPVASQPPAEPVPPAPVAAASSNAAGSKEKRRVNVIIGITTAYSHREMRMANRETWLTLPNRPEHNGVSWVYYFLLGSTSDEELRKKAQEEADQYKDMLFFDFVDVYQNLTLKTTAAIDYWVENFDFDYWLKIDDDSYLQTDRYLEISKRFHKERWAWGYVGAIFDPDRDPNGKWFVPFDEWPGTRQNPPRFNLLHGPCYTLSRDVCEIHYRRTREPGYSPIRLEDANVGIVLAEAGITPTASYQFNPGVCPFDPNPGNIDCLIGRHYCTVDVQQSQHRVYLERRKNFPDGQNCVEIA